MNAVIEARQLEKDFYIGFRRKHVKAVESMTFEVADGEIFGLIGPNGAGKTTTIKMLTALIKPTKGSATILGFDAGSKQARAQIGYLPEISYYYDYLTGEELLTFYGRLYGMRGDHLKQSVRTWLERTGLRAAASKRLRQYSKGMQQRLGLAQALIGDPRIVILDEPQSGLDPIGRADVAEIILEAKKRGKTVFLSSHILPDVEKLCDRVAVVRRGSVIACDTPENLSGKAQKVVFSFAGANLSLFLEEMSRHEHFVDCRERAGRLYLSMNSQCDVNAVIRLATDKDLEILQVNRETGNLESFFAELNGVSGDKA